MKIRCLIGTVDGGKGFQWLIFGWPPYVPHRSTREHLSAFNAFKALRARVPEMRAAVSSFNGFQKAKKNIEATYYEPGPHPTLISE